MAVALSLTGLYCGYAVVTRPLLELPTLSVAAPVGPMNAPPRPVENVRVAQTHLPQQEWAANAKYHLKSHQAFIYANAWEPEGATGRVRLRPFAMVWLATNSKTGVEEPVTIVSESAVIRFAGAFELPTPNPGRLVHAILDGRAQVNGPNGLVIDGRNFTFSEAAGRLWSDHEVRYEYAGNRGSADILEIDLIPQEGEPGKDRPHIFGIQNVRLSRNVKMELQLKERDAAMPLKIKCNGSFEYDVLGERATFTDDVVAFRQTGATAFDWIDCDRLMLQFETPDDDRPSRPLPVAGHPDSYQQLDTRLKFVWLQADAAAPTPHDESPPILRLYSTDNQLEARAAQLQYHGDSQQVRLAHPDGVRVLHARHPVLHCPEVLLTLGEGQRLQAALCRGAGWFVHRDSRTGAVSFAADWKTHLQHAVDPLTGLDRIELHDTASFRQPERELALGAEWLRVWLRQPDKQSGNDGEVTVGKPPVNINAVQQTSFHTTGAGANGNGNGAGASTPGGRLPLSGGLDEVTAERFEAQGDVVFVSPRLEGQSQTLEVWVDHSLPPVEPLQSPPRRDAVNSTNSGTNGNGAAAGQAHADGAAPEAPVSAMADAIRVRLRPGLDKSPDFADLWAEGKVALHQTTGEAAGEVSIRGDRAHVENRGGNQQIVHLYGKPAQIIDLGRGVELEAAVMHLDRADNQFRVDGAGTLQLPIDRDLNGKPLTQAGKMLVSWQERMGFDGMLATFHGQAVATLEDRRLKCETMEVTLTERIRFDSPPQKSSTPIELQAIVCRNHVELKSQQYEDRKLVEIQTAEVWELRLDRITGDMFAQGPGMMHMWRRGNSPRGGLAPAQSAAANSPIQVETSEWQYTRVKFDGQMNGQLEHRHAVFKERVEILHGPVKLPNQKLTREQLPKAGGFLSCQELQVKQVPGEAGDRNRLQIAGDGNAWLEGEGFAASADKIVYDEVREAYLIYGKGRNNARFWHNVAPGVERPPVYFQRGEFLPATRRLQVDAVSSAEGGR